MFKNIESKKLYRFHLVFDISIIMPCFLFSPLISYVTYFYLPYPTIGLIIEPYQYISLVLAIIASCAGILMLLKMRVALLFNLFLVLFFIGFSIWMILISINDFVPILPEYDDRWSMIQTLLGFIITFGILLFLLLLLFIFTLINCNNLVEYFQLKKQKGI